MRVVEIVGGPHDGQQIAIPDAEHTVRFPALSNTLRHPSIADPDSRPELSVRVVELRLHETDKGWRIYWNEGHEC